MSTCVCVLSNSGERLMPTIRLGKVRRLLKDGKAKIIKHHGTHTKKNGSVNVEFKTPSRGGKKSASLKKLKIVKTSNLMHSAWTKVS